MADGDLLSPMMFKKKHSVMYQILIFFPASKKYNE